MQLAPSFDSREKRGGVCLPARILLEVQLVDVVGLENEWRSEQDHAVGVDRVVTQAAGGELFAPIALYLDLYQQFCRVVGKAPEVFDIPQRELFARAVVDVIADQI